ncbi:hypothetical protein cyc_05991 [Cyclospora cayetanensis]|uniref:Uncharacterized protein n=1 Tax=Cyclospora cayetanensis TaxID=88456 RepID=A0A1D3DB83_9EIME|nr:hypothetical protein cyc_05991 [Cyclospora cayetanensis]
MSGSHARNRRHMALAAAAASCSSKESILGEGPLAEAEEYRRPTAPHAQHCSRVERRRGGRQRELHTKACPYVCSMGSTTYSEREGKGKAPVV